MKEATAGSYSDSGLSETKKMDGEEDQQRKRKDDCT
jgi:hypothetical protein